MIDKIIKTTISDPKVIKIRDEIRKDFYNDFDWTCGGCFAFAEAIVAVLKGSELWVVGSYEQAEYHGEPSDWAAQHAIVKYKGIFYDATGKVTKEFLLANFGVGRRTKIGKVETWIKSKPPHGLWYPQQEFVMDKEIKLIGGRFLDICRQIWK